MRIRTGWHAIRAKRPTRPPPQALYISRLHAGPPAIPPARPLRPRDHQRGRAGRHLHGSRERRGVRGRGGAPAARALAQRAALCGREPAPVRLLPRAAGPARPERLPALRPAAAGRHAPGRASERSVSRIAKRPGEPTVAQLLECARPAEPTACTTTLLGVSRWRLTPSLALLALLLACPGCG